MVGETVGVGGTESESVCVSVLESDDVIDGDGEAVYDAVCVGDAVPVGGGDTVVDTEVDSVRDADDDCETLPEIVGPVFVAEIVGREVE